MYLTDRQISFLFIDVLVHKYYIAHIMPILKRNESFGHTFATNEHGGLSVYTIDGLQAKFGCTREFSFANVANNSAPLFIELERYVTSRSVLAKTVQSIAS